MEFLVNSYSKTDNYNFFQFRGCIIMSGSMHLQGSSLFVRVDRKPVLNGQISYHTLIQMPEAIYSQ